MSSREFTGGCLCGEVRYRAVAPIVSSSICHCGTCRRASGAPSVAWFVIGRDQFQWLRGDAVVSYQSSQNVVRQFCRCCGSQLAYIHSDAPHRIELTTATLDDPEAIPPTIEIWGEHRLSWEAVDPNRPLDPQESQAGDTPSVSA